MKLELALLAWSLRKMEEELGEASSSKEVRWGWCSSLTSCSGDPPARLRRGGGAQWWGRRESSSMAKSRERGLERVRE